MNKINIVSLLLISIISISTWAHTSNKPISIINIASKNTTYELNSAPFGFRWGDDLNEVKSNLTGQYEIIEDLENCPFIIVKSNNLDETIKGTGEYELLIMSKYEGITFDGLMAVSYKSKPANVKDYYSLLGKIIKNLTREYGVLQQARSIDRSERYYFFEGKDLTINLTAEQYKDYFSIDLEYAFTGYRNNEETEQDYFTAVEECKKQRSQH